MYIYRTVYICYVVLDHFVHSPKSGRGPELHSSIHGYTDPNILIMAPV